MKRHFLPYLLLLSAVIGQVGCKSSQKSQHTGMDDVPYIPPIIDTNPPPSSQEAPPIREEEVVINTPPPIKRDDLQIEPPQQELPPPPERIIETQPIIEEEMPATLGGYPKERIRFRVQIGAFKTALAESDPFFKNIAGEEVRVERAAENIYRYSLGWFDNYEKAETYKNDLKAKGFSSAFLVAFGDDDKRINIGIDKVLEWYLK